MSWHRRWMDMALLVTSWSKDRSRHCGAVIVDDRETLVSVGWNGFPRGVNDDIDEHHSRPAKYQWTECAERNAIFNAASNGNATKGCKIYLSWYPCANCARAIIQCGISTMYCIEPDWNDVRYASDFAVVKQMMKEGRVSVRFMKGEAPKRKD